MFVGFEKGQTRGSAMLSGQEGWDTKKNVEKEARRACGGCHLAITCKSYLVLYLRFS